MRKEKDSLKIEKDFSKEWTPERIAEENAKQEKRREDARRIKEEREASLKEGISLSFKELNLAKLSLQKSNTPTTYMIKPKTETSRKSSLSQKELPAIVPLRKELDSEQSAPEENLKLLPLLLKKMKRLELKVDQLQKSLDNIDIDEIDRITMQKLHEDFANLAHNAEMYVRHKRRCNIRHHPLKGR